MTVFAKRGFEDLLLCRRNELRFVELKSFWNLTTYEKGICALTLPGVDKFTNNELDATGEHHSSLDSDIASGTSVPKV